MNKSTHVLQLLAMVTVVMTLLFMIGCATGTPFLGAQKVRGNFYYIERWYLQPEYSRRDLPNPSGTGFYGAAAEQYRDRFIVKYYINDGERSDVEIPPEDMWKVLHNGKEGVEQDDDDLFFYEKTEQGFIKYWASAESVRPSTIPVKDGNTEFLIPIEFCDTEGWCLLYSNRREKPMYVKRSILYQGPTILNPVQKQKLALQKLYAEAQSKTAAPPWVTPNEEACLNNYGKFEQNTRVKNDCIATLSAAKRICQASDARLPTIEELAQVIAECVETSKQVEEANQNTAYQICYRQKGFYSSRYYSSTQTTTERELRRPAWNRRELVLLASFSRGSTNNISDPDLKYSVICRSNEPS